tara:strand:+ start:1314 stop:1613 length:300 start_codon:yes stop_codon:yes gene_type:complete
MRPKVIDAIIAIDPDARVVVRNKTEVEWLDSNPNDISESEIQSKLSELLSKYEAESYSRARKTAYDALNQFELISDDSINGTTTHKDAIAKIKSDHPKT